MPSEYRDLPMPTARQRIIGRWTPETTNTEKQESVIHAIRARIDSLMHIARKITLQSYAVNEAVSYLAGASCSEVAADDMSTCIIHDEDALNFLLQLDVYLSDRFDMADHSELHFAAETYKSKCTDFSSLPEEERMRIISNLMFQIKRYLSYLRNLGQPYPFKTIIAKTVKGDHMRKFLDNAIHDMYTIEGFSVFEQLLLESSGQSKFVEMREMIDLLQELKSET